MFKKSFLAVFMIFGLSSSAYTQCPDTLLFEDFNMNPIIGRVGANLVGNPTLPGGGVYNFDGTPHGWFNIGAGIPNADVYDRNIIACIGVEIEISIFIRRGDGGPNVNVDLIAEDAFGAPLATLNLNLSNTMYELHTLNFTLLTSTNFNFIIHSNTTGSSAGADIITENLLITYNDNIFPTASNPVDLNVECITDAPIDPTVVIDEADNCSIPTVAFVSDVSDGGLCPEVITRTYSVTDFCGNTINVSHDITIQDITNPTASNPAPLFIDCIEDLPLPDPTVVIDEADNCAVFPVVAFVSEVSDGGFCPEIITRTYSVTDTCENSINVTHTITIIDVTNPTASNPLPITVECIGDIPAPDITVVTDEADNCTVFPIVAFVSDASNGATCPEIITRTYSVTDTCGNVLNVSQTITVNDITNPTASNPAPVNVECISDAPIDLSVVTDASDNCSTPTVAFVSDVSNGASCPEVITRTYSVTDDCGNTINVTQAINVNDLTDPTASNPPDIIVSCVSDIPPADEAVVVDEADNCAAPIVAFVSEVSDGNVCNNETITRTYSVTDDCGNTITVTQSIIIQATTPSVNAGLDLDGCDGIPVTLFASNPNSADITWDPAITDGVPFLLPIGTSNYSVTASICGGECTATDDVDVTINPLPVVSFEADNESSCTGQTINFSNTSTDAFTCKWDFGNGNVSNICTEVSTVYAEAGNYDVTLEITSEEGCSAIETYANFITIDANPIADFSFSPEELDAFNTEVEFTNESLFSDSYEWNFGDGRPIEVTESPTHTFMEETGGEYLVTLTAGNNSNNCTATTQRTIVIDDILIYYIPNTFTPGEANINETYKPVFFSGFDIYDYHLLIFNRWGEIIFESFDADQGWDGTYNNQPCPIAAYVWHVEFGLTSTREIFTESGHVTLLK